MWTDDSNFFSDSCSNGASKENVSFERIKYMHLDNCIFWYAF